MIRRAFLILILAIMLFSIYGCNTAKGIKDDVVFIGDKTAEVINKPVTK